MKKQDKLYQISEILKVARKRLRGKVEGDVTVFIRLEAECQMTGKVFADPLQSLRAREDKPEFEFDWLGRI